MNHSSMVEKSGKRKSYIWITRPESEAQEFSNELNIKGFDTYIAPLLHVEYFENALANIDFSKYSHFIATSVNALRASCNYLNFNSQILVVGSKLAEKALNMGFSNVINAGKDSKELVYFIKKNFKLEGNNFLYLSPEEPSFDVVSSLTDMGYHIEKSIVYNTIMVEELSETTKKFISSGEIKSVVLFSVKTAKALLNIINKYNMIDYSANLELFCLSDQISEVICSDNRVSFKSIKIAEFPNRESVISLIIGH